MGAKVARESRMRKIDGQKLKVILDERKTNKRELSREMGFESSYLNHAIGRGEMNVGGMRVLEILTGISPDEYKWEEPQEEVAEEIVVEADNGNDTPLQFDGRISVGDDAFWQKLSLTIFHAVYEAVSKAWNEPINIRKDEMRND